MSLILERLSKKQLILGFSTLLVFVGILVTTIAFAASKPKIVYFYADWNLRCREARPVIQQVVSTYGNRVDFVSLNIDDSATPDAARSLGTSVPRTVPYIVVIGKNDRVIYEKVYTGETPQQLKAQLDPAILSQL